MRWHFILRTMGILLSLLGLSMTLPLIVSFYYHEQTWHIFLQSFGITTITGILLIIFSKKQDLDDFINQKEGMATVALAWCSIGIFGALPFYLSPEFILFSDAVFESVSGFSTTGSSVITNIEMASKSLLFWRNLIQWLGGMGIIVLSLAYLNNPMLSVCYLDTPVDYRAIDNRPLSILFFLLCPSLNMHLQLLSVLSFCLRDSQFTEFLKSKPDPNKLVDKITIFQENNQI